MFDIEIFQFRLCLNSLIIIKVPVSQQEHLQIFPTSLTKWNMCASFRFRVREKPEKYFQLSAWRREFYEPGPRFFIIWQRWIYIIIYILNLLVCNSGQYIYVTGLCNFFFVLQNLIDRINSYFRRIAFQRNLLLVNFQHSTSQVFSGENKQPSLEWHCVNW